MVSRTALAASSSKVITQLPVTWGLSSISLPRLVSTTLVSPFDPPCWVQVAWITFRVLTGFAAAPSLVSLVTVDEGEGDQGCGVSGRRRNPDGYPRRPTREAISRSS